LGSTTPLHLTAPVKLVAIPGKKLEEFNAPCKSISNIKNSTSILMIQYSTWDAGESNKLIFVIPFGSAPESITHDFAASSA
jgi:hypothetical protein